MAPLPQESCASGSDIVDGRVLAHPQSAIDARTEVLGKLPMQEWTHETLLLLRANQKLLLAFRGCPHLARHHCRYRCRRACHGQAISPVPQLLHLSALISFCASSTTIP